MRRIENKPWIRESWGGGSADLHIFSLFPVILGGLFVLFCAVCISIDVLTNQTGMADFFTMIGIQAFTAFFLWYRGNLKFRIAPKAEKKNKELEAEIDSYRAVLQRVDEESYVANIQKYEMHHRGDYAFWSFVCGGESNFKTREEANEWARSELLRLERIKEIKAEKWELTV